MRLDTSIRVAAIFGLQISNLYQAKVMSSKNKPYRDVGFIF